MGTVMASMPAVAADGAFAVGVRADHSEFLRVQQEHAQLLESMSVWGSSLFASSDSSSEDEPDYDATHRASLAVTYNTIHAGVTPANSGVAWWSPSESEDEGGAASTISI